MAPTLFVSDLHLCQSRPQVARRFLEFLQAEATTAAALYILGDLFEYWIGDDDTHDAFNSGIAAALQALTTTGTPVYLMHGNRDFLIGDAFAAATGVQLLADPVCVDISGTAALLMHGDTLCTDDAAYLNFRATVRAPEWQRAFLALPLAARRAQVEELRRQSEAEKRGKPMALMDVNPTAVIELLRRRGVPPRLIHGHTHRPACHHLTVDGKACERWVLAAWEDTPSYLAVDAGGCRSICLG